MLGGAYNFSNRSTADAGSGPLAGDNRPPPLAAAGAARPQFCPCPAIAAPSLLATSAAADPAIRHLCSRAATCGSRRVGSQQSGPSAGGGGGPLEQNVSTGAGGILDAAPFEPNDLSAEI